MATPEILILADDLTGAIEAGAFFSRAMVGIERDPAAPVSVIDLESRHLDPDAATAQVKRFARDAPFLYLKIDSTLRGPIAAQLHALAELRLDRAVCFTPAYPALGRTVSNGQLFVNGAPLHETAFSNDPTHPARTSEIAGIRPLDAASEADLIRIARCLFATSPPHIAAGSAGLLKAICGTGAFACARRSKPDEALPHSDTAPLILNGSKHPVSREQLLHAGAWPVLDCTALPHDPEALTAVAVSARNRILVEATDTIIVFGGDTARALMRALNISFIEPIGEAFPGIPVSRIIFESRPITLITKAGGFGPPDLLPQLAAALQTEI